VDTHGVKRRESLFKRKPAVSVVFRYTVFQKRGIRLLHQQGNHQGGLGKNSWSNKRRQEGGEVMGIKPAYLHSQLVTSPERSSSTSLEIRA